MLHLTLARHAYGLIAGLAGAVIEGSAPWLGRVLQVGARQAGAQASWSPLWFVSAGWTSWKDERRGYVVKKKHSQNHALYMCVYVNVTHRTRHKRMERLDDGCIKEN